MPLSKRSRSARRLARGEGAERPPGWPAGRRPRPPPRRAPPARRRSAAGPPGAGPAVAPPLVAGRAVAGAARLRASSALARLPRGGRLRRRASPAPPSGRGVAAGRGSAVPPPALWPSARARAGRGERGRSVVRPCAPPSVPGAGGGARRRRGSRPRLGGRGGRAWLRGAAASRPGARRRGAGVGSAPRGRPEPRVSSRAQLPPGAGLRRETPGPGRRARWWRRTAGAPPRADAPPRGAGAGWRVPGSPSAPRLSARVPPPGPARPGRGGGGGGGGGGTPAGPSGRFPHPRARYLASAPRRPPLGEPPVWSRVPARSRRLRRRAPARLGDGHGPRAPGPEGSRPPSRAEV